MLLVKFSLLILFASFLVSVLCFFFYGFLSEVIALPTITIAIVGCRSLSLIKAISIRLPLLFADAFKSKVGRPMTKLGKIEKRPILEELPFLKGNKNYFAF